MTRTNRSRTPRQVRARRTAPRAVWPSVFAALWSRLRRGGGGRAVTAVLLLICASLLTGAGLGGATQTGESQQRATLRVSPPPGLPPVARWVDVNRGTSYTVALPRIATARLATAGERFTFTTPVGDQLVAGLPIAKLPDGSYTQSSPLNAATGALTCFQGVLNLNSNGGGNEPIVYTLVTHFDQYALVAYAHLVYASARDKLGVAGVCSGQTGLGGEQALDMLSGCDATTCTSPVDTAGPAVATFESSVVGAAKQGNPQSWKQAYSGTSRVITAQYDSDRFGTLIEGQVQKKGRIKSITPKTPSPQIQFDAAGQAYFSVTDAVELDKGSGNTSTVTVTSYYLLESGQWEFWFSMPVES